MPNQSVGYTHALSHYKDDTMIIQMLRLKVVFVH